MRRSFLIVSLIAATSFAAPVVFAQQFSSVEERMSSADFKAAGLDKLSPEELARLNAFVRNEVGRGSSQAREGLVQEQEQKEAERMGFKDHAGPREAITSTIVGNFTGWTGGTTFTLANGQVWREVDSDGEFVVRLTNPVVYITPGLFGNWLLHVQGYGSSAKVERIQ